MTPRSEAVVCAVFGALVVFGCVLVAVLQALAMVARDCPPVWLLGPFALMLLGLWSGIILMAAGMGE